MLRPFACLALLFAAGCATAATDATSASDLTIAELPIQIGGITAGTFVQAVDHADATKGTFAQRYFVSTAFASGIDAPVIIVFCGEAECTPGYVEVMGDMAKTLHASVVALEHRFYGQSQPGAANLATLTIANALEDAASFEAYAKTSLGLGGKWIAAGGSYGGMLAAFYRVKHPELVVGAWASSAPVNVQESFSGYDQIAAEALGTDCDALVRTAIQTAEDAVDDPVKWDTFSALAWGSVRSLPATMTDAKRRELKITAANWVTTAAISSAQYGTTTRLCSALAQHADDPVMGLAGYYQAPSELVADLGPGAATSNPSVGASPQTPSLGASPQTPWFYQQCTELGFFKVPNPDRTATIMSALITVDSSRAECTNMFGHEPAIAATRASYLQPILDGAVTNLFFVNGSLDPWSALSVTSAPGVTTKTVALGAHCSDFSNLTSDSLLGVFEAHKQLHDLALTWLQ